MLLNLLILASAFAFVFEALEVVIGKFHAKWWALGIAFWLFSQVIGR